MMKKLRVYVVWGVLVWACGLAANGDAFAADAWSYGPFPYPYLVPIVSWENQGLPYYAAYPPVYYSHVVARPYGYSPYAYLPGVVTPGFEARGPRYPLGPRDVWGSGPNWRRHGRAAGQYDSQNGEKAAPESALPSASTHMLPRPAVIENEYFHGRTVSLPKHGRASGGPLQITNPYVVTGDEYRTAGAETAADR